MDVKKVIFADELENTITCPNCGCKLELKKVE